MELRAQMLQAKLHLAISVQSLFVSPGRVRLGLDLESKFSFGMQAIIVRGKEMDRE
jgi:hypothetical protein